MPVHDELGKRMKENYETRSKTYLIRRTPVIIRIDGRAFHTFTRGFNRPFDEVLAQSMRMTMKYLCENIQGCLLGYTQSDEITLVLQDYKELTTDAWFNYEVQKICSIAASMATMAFNKYFKEFTDAEYNLNLTKLDISLHPSIYTEDWLKVREAHIKAMNSGAMFDARCFNIPIEEVTNCLYWREIDAVRNSIQMVGQANFSQKELQNKTCADIKDMLKEKKDIDFDEEIRICYQRGVCCYRVTDSEEPTSYWALDFNIPMFCKEGREYIEKILRFEPIIL